MLLHEVLHVLSKSVNPRKFTHSSLYASIFCENIDADIDAGAYENIAKKCFSKNERRPLSTSVYSFLETMEGFDFLCSAISNRYLPSVKNPDDLCHSLETLIAKDSYLPDSLKSEICKYYDRDGSLSCPQFVALCIICANRNTILEKENALNTLEYPINISDLLLPPVSALEYGLWKASCSNFHSMRAKGARFAALDIIEGILPKGHIARLNYDAKSVTKDGNLISALEICRTSTENLSIIGDGGIGKTTLMQKIMENEFKDKPDGISPEDVAGHAIPFFIELNRCPRDIARWYDDTVQKTNFITRYIAWMYNGASSLYAVRNEDIDTIEREFKKEPVDGLPRYLLLLDGFNEVYSGNRSSVRAELSNEITLLSCYPNVRIITTSRQTQTADYASSFRGLPLIGLEKDDIISYLGDCGYDDVQISLITANHSLMKCLRIPLYICMFCAEKNGDAKKKGLEGKSLPETVGEIFYNFFHRNGSFYNIKKRARDTHTNPYDDAQTSFILDFILPYIGWHFESIDTFDMSRADLQQLIQGCVETTLGICTDLNDLPFPEYEYSVELLQDVASSFATDNIPSSCENVIDCLQNYLGLLYRVEDRGAGQRKYSDRIRYAFTHHQFRDYFSAMWDVQLLRILPCYNTAVFSKPAPMTGYDNRLDHFIDTSYFSQGKTRLISEILLERKNQPFYENNSGVWKLPAPTTDEQRVLANVLEYCRGSRRLGNPLQTLVKNATACILDGRGELSGMNLRGLDFSRTNLYNVTCSHFGANGTLSADFCGSVFSENSFMPEDHQDLIVDYQYYGDHCYTLDMAGILKCWDTMSGNLHAQLNIGELMSLSGNDPEKYIKVSPDNRWMTIIQQVKSERGLEVWLTCLDFKLNESLSNQIRINIPTEKHTEITDYFFTAKSDGILLLCDNLYVYGQRFDTTTSGDDPFITEPHLSLPREFCVKVPLFAGSSLIQMDSITDDHFILFTAHYTPSAYEEFEPVDDTGELSDEDLYACEIYEWSLTEQREQLLHRFSGIN